MRSAIALTSLSPLLLLSPAALRTRERGRKSGPRTAVHCCSEEVCLKRELGYWVTDNIARRWRLELTKKWFVDRVLVTPFANQLINSAWTTLWTIGCTQRPVWYAYAEIEQWVRRWIPLIPLFNYTIQSPYRCPVIARRSWGKCVGAVSSRRSSWSWRPSVVYCR